MKNKEVKKPKKAVKKPNPQHPDEAQDKKLIKSMMKGKAC